MTMRYRSRDGTSWAAGPSPPTKKGRRLAHLDRTVPWEAWARIIESRLGFGHNPPEARGRGRPRIQTETMLRMLVAQRAFTLSDRECEEECRENASVQAFLGTTRVPDHTTLCKFRNLLASAGILRALFQYLVRLPRARGAIKTGATLVDATFIESPSSTKNRARARDPDAHSAKKGNVWHFGHEAHAGADRDSGLVHTVIVTAANVADINMGKDLVRPGDDEVYLDAGYIGIDKREEAGEGGELGGKDLYVAAKRSTARTDEQRFREHAVPGVRSPAGHPFHYPRDIIGLRKTPYKGLPKNDEMLCLAFSIVNLLMLPRRRVALAG